MEREAGLSVLLTRRADTLRSHTGQIALPGGRCDPGETPWQTALREAHEEIGLDPALRRRVAGLSTPYRTGTGYLITPVVGFVRPGFTLTPNPGRGGRHLRDAVRLPDGPAAQPRRQRAQFYADQRPHRAHGGMLRASTPCDLGEDQLHLGRDGRACVRALYDAAC